MPNFFRNCVSKCEGCDKIPPLLALVRSLGWPALTNIGQLYFGNRSFEMKEPVMDEFTLKLILRYWRPFAIVALALFIVASLTIFALPQNYTVRSIVEVGALVEPRGASGVDRPEPLEPPDQTAKRIQEVFLPDEIAALTGSGLPSAGSANFQNMKAEVIGRTIVIQGSAKASSEAAYKELQQRIIDRVMSDHAAIARGIREGLNHKIKLQRQSVDDLAQGIKRIEDESNRLQKSDDEARARLTALREELTLTQKQTPTPQSAGESTAAQTADRLLYQQINESSEHRGNLNAARTRVLLDGLTTKSIYDGLAESLANNERTLRMLKDTHVILQPTSASTPVGPRRFYLLIVAMIGSILLSVGAVLLFDRFASLRKY
jgi:hypothetical protein